MWFSMIICVTHFRPAGTFSCKMCCFSFICISSFLLLLVLESEPRHKPRLPVFQDATYRYINHLVGKFVTHSLFSVCEIQRTHYKFSSRGARLPPVISNMKSIVWTQRHQSGSLQQPAGSHCVQTAASSFWSKARDMKSGEERHLLGRDRQLWHGAQEKHQNLRSGRRGSRWRKEKKKREKSAKLQARC